ncbi:hypothetical protein M9H77_21007 [Catharanthus roseus]|uniref:Uncharacterized protein n=1 Tax=Catharanthus roseus TaxID=4058 RepID=A0ACC0AM87_CATRO|nr:hypothetical protein M9H77_21007 [Catharanthus roseus]
MENCDLEEFNCNVINHSESIGVDFMLLEYLEEEVTCNNVKCLVLNAVVIEISIEDSLVGSVILSEEDAFKLYNDHAFGLGFSVHKRNQKFKRHYMHSQRRVAKNNVGYLQEFKDNGVSVAAALRVLKKQVGGSTFVGFASRNVYNIFYDQRI